MTSDLLTRIAVAIHGATPPNPDAALALHQAQAERVLPVVEAEVARLRAEVEVAVADLVTQLKANIPLGRPDPQWDPNDEFKRCAVDRAERVVRWRDSTLRAALATAEEPETHPNPKC